MIDLYSWNDPVESRAAGAAMAPWRTLILLLVGLFISAGAWAQAAAVVKKIDVTSNGGTVKVLADGTAWFAASGTPNGQLGEPAYVGSQTVVHAVGAGAGVVTLFSGGGIYFSPDGMNLGGGGITVRAYGGTQQVIRFAAVNGGVVTVFSGGAAYFSPDGRNVGGGGNTVRAYGGTQSIVGLTEIPGALRTRFSGGGEYISTNGLSLGGGGSTVRTPAWHNFRTRAC
jgi:hypothetical protein